VFYIFYDCSDQVPGTSADTAVLPGLVGAREIPEVDDAGKSRCRQGADQ